MLKKLKNKKVIPKILLLITVFSVLASLLVLPSSAAGIGELDAGYYSFKEDLSFAQPSFTTLETSFYYFDGFKYISCTAFNFYYRGHFIIEYVSDSTVLTVYDSDTGWVNDYYRTIFFPDVVSFQGILDLNWFSSLIEPIDYYTPVSQGSYYMIYETLRNYIYGDRPLNSDMSLSLSLISTFGSLFVVIIPFVLVYFVLRLFRFI